MQTHMGTGRRRTNAARGRGDMRGAGPRRARGIQIGPRIRVGGSIGKAAQKLKENVGKVAKTVAPLATIIPGVGPLAAAGIGALGTALDTSKGSVGLGNIALSGAKGYVGAKALDGITGKLGSAVKVGSIADLLKGGGKDGQGNLGAIGDLAGGLLTGGGTDGKGTAGYLGDLLGKATASGGGVGGSSLLDTLLGAGGIAAATEDSMRRRGMEDEARKAITGSFAARAPLRERGMAMALNPGKPDLGGVFQTGAKNPFALAPRVAVTPPASGAAPAAPAAPAALPRPGAAGGIRGLIGAGGDTAPGGLLKRIAELQSAGGMQ